MGSKKSLERVVTLSRLVLLVAALETVACNDASSMQGPSASGSGSSTPIFAGVKVDGDGVWLAGKKVDAAPKDELIKLEGLISAVSQASSVDNLMVSLPDDISCQAAMSVLGAVSLAQPNITLEAWGSRHSFRIARQSDLPQTKGIVDPVLSFSAKDDVSIEKTACRSSYDVVQSNEVGGAVTNMLVAPERIEKVYARCEPGVKFAQVFNTLFDVKKKHEPQAPAPTARVPGEGSMGDAPAGTSTGIQLGFVPACAQGASLPWSRSTKNGPDPDAPTAPWGRDEPTLAALKPIPVPQDFKGDMRIVAMTDLSSELKDERVREAILKTKDKVVGCYAAGRAASAVLRGSVTATLHFGRKGTVVSVADSTSDLPNSSVVACVVDQLWAATLSAEPALTQAGTAKVRIELGDAAPADK